MDIPNHNEPRYLFSECCLEDVKRLWFNDDYVSECRSCNHQCAELWLTEAEAEKMRKEREGETK